MSEPDGISRTVIPEHLMLSRLAQSEQLREFFIQMWIQNSALARQGGSKVQNLLSPLAIANAEKSGSDPNAPRGFALVSAIFLLVVLAALALFMLSLSGTQHFTSAWAVQGARAHYAALSGIEWGAWQAVNNGGTSCNGSPAVDPGGPAGFMVTVTCMSSPHQEGGGARTVWVIDATAESGSFGGPGFVHRRQRIVVLTP